jgi:hypothetical protein
MSSAGHFDAFRNENKKFTMVKILGTLGDQM